MTNIEPEELSAYVDGELTLERRREIDIALAADASLRAELDSLRALDAQLKRVAVEHRFEPSVAIEWSVVLPKQTVLGIAFIVLALATIRLVPKFLNAHIWDWLLVNGVALTVLLAGTAWLLARETDRREPQSASLFQ